MESAKETLVKYLELAFDKPYNREKAAIVATLPKELSYNQDGAIKTIQRELLLTEAIETTGLVQTAVSATVAEGANLAKCWFNILPVWRIKGNAYNHAYGEAGMYAAQIPEAAEIPNRSQDYSNAAFVTLKYAQSPKISKEMIEDAMVDVIAEEIKFAGIAVQNAVERICNNAILEGSGSEWDTTATAGSQGIKAIIKAMAVNRGYGFMPGGVVMTPGLEGYCLLDLAAPNVNQSLVGNGSIQSGFLGMKWGVCAIADVAGGTYTWGSGTDNYIYGLVVDPMKAGGIAVSRPLTVDEYADPVHDLHGMNVSMRMDCKPFASTAICRVVY